MTFRGPSPFAGDGFGTGGNTVMKATSGTVPAGSSTGQWHPTIIYLFALLIVEWIGLIVLTKYI